MAVMLPNLFVSLLLSFAVSLLYIYAKAYRSRRIIADLRRQGMPMPPFSWIAGHMLAAGPFLEKLPADAIFNYSIAELARGFPEEKMFYLDFWPINDPFLIVVNPVAASQITKTHTAPKPMSVSAAFATLSGGPNLFTMPDDEWKFWHSVFSPGFSAARILGQVPAMLLAAQTFRCILRKKAELHQLFLLEEATLRMTLDVIGLVILGSNFNSQVSESEFATRLRSLVGWTSFGAEVNPFRRWNPVRPLMCWYQGRYVDKFIQAELKKTMARRRDCPSGKDGKQDSISSMAFDRYLDKIKESGASAADSTFLRYGTSQTRLFLVGSFDTTPSAKTYALHLLNKHPKALSKIRAEHNLVFGRDIAATSAILAANPSLLNRLPFTTAVVKETLRLFPPASAIRMGSPDQELTSDGRSYPTANCSVWVVHTALHRDPSLWPRPDDFLPERWLAEPNDPLHPPSGAWRPFEVGPRACLGQTLAMTEVKVTLVMTVREFDVQPAYDEWYKLHPMAGIKAVNGELAYQVDGGGGGSHTARQYPCRVTLRT